MDFQTARAREKLISKQAKDKYSIDCLADRNWTAMWGGVFQELASKERVKMNLFYGANVCFTQTHGKVA